MFLAIVFVDAKFIHSNSKELSSQPCSQPRLNGNQYAA